MPQGNRVLDGCRPRGLTPDAEGRMGRSSWNTGEPVTTHYGVVISLMKLIATHYGVTKQFDGVHERRYTYTCLCVYIDIISSLPVFPAPPCTYP